MGLFFQESVPPLPPSTTVAGKTIIITGASSGLGLEAARQFLQLKASRVILAVRSIGRGEVAAAQIQPVNPDAEIKVMHLDLDSYDSVIAFANQIKRNLPELHVLLLNAGLTQYDYVTSATGHEQILQVNFLSHAVLALELLPLLQRTAAKDGSPTRLSLVSSYFHRDHTLAKIPIHRDESIIQHFDNRANYVQYHRYSDTKLLINAFVAELARRLPLDKNKDSPVIVNCLCPGFVDTKINDHLPWYVRCIMWFIRRIFARRVSVGARTMVHAVAVAEEETHGKFLESCHLAESSPFLQGPDGREFEEKLFKEVLEEARKVDSSAVELFS
ncbi:hypothetical protein VTN77DRAFT_9314 [Rasamsonia byssochlamydoides]|uniref:uncharacterized protein n=1 Tax=Rasamsonia byssochlamydoides TaxID=89139 RepID=UPI0037434F0C